MNGGKNDTNINSNKNNKKRKHADGCQPAQTIAIYYIQIQWEKFQNNNNNNNKTKHADSYQPACSLYGRITEFSLKIR